MNEHDISRSVVTFGVILLMFKNFGIWAGVVFIVLLIISSTIDNF